jgi:hypothetical protein
VALTFERDRDAREGSPTREAEQARVLSKQDRIDLLIQTITQEAFKSIQYAIYAEDRVLVQYLIATEILQAENCIEPNLFDFLIAGPRHISYETELPWKGDAHDKPTLPWITRVIWADLTELSRLKPFSRENLLQHILQHKAEWSAFTTEAAARGTRALSFRDLPNKEMLNFAYFRDADPQRLAELNKLAVRAEQERDRQHDRAPSSRAITADGPNRESTLSDGKTRGDTALKHSESEILNDPGIWEVSDSDESTGSPPEEDGGGYGGPDTAAEEMARYLIEKAP